MVSVSFWSSFAVQVLVDGVVSLERLLFPGVVIVGQTSEMNLGLKVTRARVGVKVCVGPPGGHY